MDAMVAPRAVIAVVIADIFRWPGIAANPTTILPAAATRLAAYAAGTTIPLPAEVAEAFLPLVTVVATVDTYALKTQTPAPLLTIRYVVATKALATASGSVRRLILTSRGAILFGTEFAEGWPARLLLLRCPSGLRVCAGLAGSSFSWLGKTGNPERIAADKLVGSSLSGRSKTQGLRLTDLRDLL